MNNNNNNNDNNNNNNNKGRLPNKKTSYSVTLSLKVGGGQDEIILLGAAKIVTR